MRVYNKGKDYYENAHHKMWGRWEKMWGRNALEREGRCANEDITILGSVLRSLYI